MAWTPAEYTVLRLQEAARGGSPVLIPGAWDRHGVPQTVRNNDDVDPRATMAAQISAVSDDERLDRELEGGGAPSQRARGRRANVFTRLWRSAVRPTDIGLIWSRVLPQPG
jgi:hypothetical protein